MSNIAVQRATGKTWDQWFKILDGRGARKLPHQDIAAILSDDLDVKPWWSQMVTVAYERARGLRDKHQKPDGYSVSASRTVGASAKAAFEAWTDAATLAQWLPRKKMFVHKSTPHRSVRITWTDGAKSVSVFILAKPGNRAQVTVQHDKLKSADDVARMRAFWKRALEALDAHVS